jgi:exodeoxyribonuclease-3
MRIISWNVNGIRSVERKGELDRILTKYDPDILLLQEIKAKPEQLSENLIKNPKYNQWYHSAQRPGYAGTAIWTKKSISKNETLKLRTGMPDFEDDEGRIACIDIGEWTIFGVYFPNGGKNQEAWKGKLEFYDQFLSFINTLRSHGRKVIWAGDVNCAHREIDLARAKENDGKIGFHPLERAWLDRVLAHDWVDVYRSLYGQKVVYSWWDVITRARQRNVGWRIDYFFVDQKNITAIKDIQYLTEQMGSDHCPVMMEIENSKKYWKQ